MSDPLSDRELMVYLLAGIPPADILDYQMVRRKEWPAEMVSVLRDVPVDEVEDGAVNVELTLQELHHKIE